MIAKLEPEFMPMAKVINDFKADVAKSESQKLVICVERNNSLTAVYELDIYKENTGHDTENYEIAERIIKTLLWAKGGYKVYIAGSRYIYERIADDYRVGGNREFDFNFMARVYEKPFEVIYVENIVHFVARGDQANKMNSTYYTIYKGKIRLALSIRPWIGAVNPSVDWRCQSVRASQASLKESANAVAKASQRSLYSCPLCPFTQTKLTVCSFVSS